MDFLLPWYSQMFSLVHKSLSSSSKVFMRLKIDSCSETEVSAVIHRPMTDRICILTCNFRHLEAWKLDRVLDFYVSLCGRRYIRNLSWTNRIFGFILLLPPVLVRKMLPVATMQGLYLNLFILLAMLHLTSARPQFGHGLQKRATPMVRSDLRTNAARMAIGLPPMQPRSLFSPSRVQGMLRASLLMGWFTLHSL